MTHEGDGVAFQRTRLVYNDSALLLFLPLVVLQMAFDSALSSVQASRVDRSVKKRHT